MPHERRKRQFRKLTPAHHLAFDRAQAALGVVLHPNMRRPEVANLLEAVQTYLQTDPLTNLPTKDRLLPLLQEIIDDRARDRSSPLVTNVEHSPCTISYCDVNYFKDHNAYLTHDSADALVAEVIELLKQKKREGVDFMARNKRDSGDEFIILSDGFNAEQAKQRFKLLNDELRTKTFAFKSLGKRITNVTLAFGCYELDSLTDELKKPADGGQVIDTMESAIRKADQIMHIEKTKMKEQEGEKLRPIVIDGEMQEGDIDVEAIMEPKKERIKLMRQPFPRL